MLQVQALRNRRHMTQVALASLVGVSQVAVAQWESGKTQPTADKLPALAQALNCTIDDLFTADNQTDQ